MVCKHLVRFGGHRHCGSEDITFLIYHWTSRDHVFKELYDFLGEKFS